MMKIFVCSAMVLLALAAIGCTGASPRFTLSRSGPGAESAPGTTGPAMSEEGVASYYAHEFDGRKTSNGETYDMHALTAAHRTLPFGTTVLVTITLNGRSVTVRINDRGPFKDDRVIDLSLEAATQIGMIGPGTARVTLQVVELGRADSTRQ